MSSHYCVVHHHLPGGFLVPRAIFQQDNWWSQQSGTRTRYPMYLVFHHPVLGWDHLWTTGPTQNSAQYEPTQGLREAWFLSPLDG